MKPTVGSLFAGIGGFDLGFERAGFETVWQVEINEWCRRVLAKNFPGAERYADIRECGAHNLRPVDVICGGFPCQDISNAGLRAGMTDVVRENNQTYRLGWSEECKDGSTKGVGMPEYLLLFRKPPTDRSNGYADVRVEKSKPQCVTPGGELVPFARDLPIAPGTGYSRARWQVDAHGFTRSSGERLLTPEELANLPHSTIFKLYREHSLSEVYNFQHHVRLGEALEAKMILPVTFMLLQPQSWHPDVWSDVTRMLTLNGSQHAKGKEMHLCPMQFDIADRAIEQFTNPGELVYDPFGGLMTVPFRAVKLGRRGRGVELNAGYFLDGCGYLKAAELEMATPTLFDLAAMEEQEAVDAA